MAAPSLCTDLTIECTGGLFRTSGALLGLCSQTVQRVLSTPRCNEARKRKLLLPPLFSRRVVQLYLLLVHRHAATGVDKRSWMAPASLKAHYGDVWLNALSLVRLGIFLSDPHFLWAMWRFILLAPKHIPQHCASSQKVITMMWDFCHLLQCHWPSNPATERCFRHITKDLLGQLGNAQLRLLSIYWTRQSNVLFELNDCGWNALLRWAAVSGGQKGIANKAKAEGCWSQWFEQALDLDEFLQLLKDVARKGRPIEDAVRVDDGNNEMYETLPEFRARQREVEERRRCVYYWGLLDEATRKYMLRCYMKKKLEVADDVLGVVMDACKALA